MIIASSRLYQKDLDLISNRIDVSKLKNKSFFITGALGLICSSFVDFLQFLNQKYQLDIKIHLACRDCKRLNNRFLIDSNMIAVEYDSLKDFSYIKGIDYYLCGAGIASPELYVSQPVETLSSNINGISNILSFCKNTSSRIIYISSSEVYGKKRNANSFCESDYGILNPNDIRSSYSIGKISCESLCRAYWKEYGNDVLIARPGHIFGPSATEKDKRLSSDFLFRAVRGESLILKSDGTQLRSYMYSLDCVYALLLLFLYGKSGEAYNIGSEHPSSIKEFVSILSNLADVPCEYKKAFLEEEKTFNPMDNSTLNIDKIKLLGYSDNFTIKQGINHTYLIMRDFI